MESWEETRKHVVCLLQEYSELKTKMEIIKHEWEHPALISPDEMLSAMAYSRALDGMPPAIGHISDKTCHIALNYRGNAYYQNKSSLEDLSDQLSQIDRKLCRLEYCVGELPSELSVILRRLYFEGVPRKTLMDELNLSESTFKRHLKKAIDKLTDLYDSLARAGTVLNW